MISKPTNILNYTKVHPIKSGLLAVFTFFTILGIGFGTVTIIAPNVADALDIGPGCCDGGWDDWSPWDPIGPVDGGGGGFGGGGGGGGGSVTPSCTLTIDPDTINEGGQTVISWTTTNATTASINNGVGSVSAGSGSQSITPSGTGTYTMTVTSTTGHQSTCTDTVTVIPDTEPMCSFSVAPSTIEEGESTTLTWTTTNATRISMNPVLWGAGGDNLAASGSMTITPQDTTTYVLTAEDDDGDRVVCTTTVYVEDIPVVNPPSCELAIVEDTISVGGSISINWSTQNADEFEINNGVGDVDLLTAPIDSGSLSATPNSDGTITYTGTVISFDGQTATCSDTVTVTPVVVDAPVCTLVVAEDTIVLGEDVTISWTTESGVSFNINGGIGSVSPASAGSISITPGTAGTYTYVGVVTGTDGQTATCSDTVTVTPVVVDAPACTLTTDGLDAGETETTIYWTLVNAVAATLNGSSITPTNGSDTVGAGTYTLVAENEDGVEVTCALVIEEPPQVDTPTCTLRADDLQIASGAQTTISWTIDDATSATLNGSSITPTNGSDTVGAGTYTLRVRNGSLSDTCSVTITTITLDELSCDLNIDRAIIRTGETADLSWTTNEAVSFEINGEDKALNGTETIQPLGVQIHTYTGVATDADGNTVECEDTVQVTGGSGGSSLSCAMSFDRSAIRTGQSATLRWEVRNADVDTIEITQGIGNVMPLDSEVVRRSDVGMHEYVLTARGDGDQVTCRATLTISGGSGGGCTSNCGGGSSNDPQVTISFLKGPGEQPLAFVTLSQIPYTGLELGPVGTVIYWVFLVVWSGAVAYLVLFKAVPFTRRKLTSLGEGVMEVLDAGKEDTMYASMPEEKEQTEFLPKQGGDEALSVEDIVRGLSRMHKEKAPEENVLDEVDVAAEMDLPPAEDVVPVAAPMSGGEDMRLLNAIVSGDKDASFGILRRVIRNGARAEDLFEKVLVHLDSAYRVRVEGGYVDEDVRRATASLDTALLEEVITALAPAIDTTYSHAQTGAKLALTRVHQVMARGQH